MPEDFEEKITVGTHHNLHCPHCGQNNSYLADGQVIGLHNIVSFQKECRGCHKIMYLEAQRIVQIHAATSPQAMSDLVRPRLR